MLQIVNSAFFGLRCQVSDASRAVMLLGLDIVKAMVLSCHVFTAFRSDLFNEADVAYTWEHSVASANYAKTIAMHEHANQQAIDDCFTAALLHDVGKVVLAFALRERYGLVLDAVKRGGKGLHEAEVEILGCSHAEVAAYLFGLWSLPSHIIEAVAYHHMPSKSTGAAFSAVTAVHLASIYHEQRAPYWMQDGTPVDCEFLARIGCLQREKSWRTQLDGEAGEKTPCVETPAE